MSGIHDPEFRSIDGTGNNQDNPGWGRAGSQFLRKTDGINDILEAMTQEAAGPVPPSGVQ